MKEYHKIINIYERDITTNKLIEGKFREPLVEYIKDLEWIGTEKVDGTNIRVHWNGKEVTFGGRTDNAQLPSNLVTWLNNKFQTITARNIFTTKFGEKKVTLFGEGYGAGIQKGGGYGTEQKFVLFDVVIDDIFLERGNVIGIAEMFDIEIVPIVCIGNLDTLVSFVKSNPKSNWGDFESEGIVARPKIEMVNRFGERIIIKIKCRDFK